jgi:hypothetical protein
MYGGVAFGRITVLSHFETFNRRGLKIAERGFAGVAELLRADWVMHAYGVNLWLFP